VEEHREKINAVGRAIVDIQARQKRLFKILEDNDDDGGTLYQRAKQRQQELDAEYARKRTELEELERTAPADSGGSVDLLDDLPHGRIDLAVLSAERLRPLLDAFAVQLHYNSHDNSVRIEVTVSANIAPHLAKLGLTVRIRHAIAPDPGSPQRARCAVASPGATVPGAADAGGPGVAGPGPSAQRCS
jgi:site-specific DNA recombinase